MYNIEQIDCTLKYGKVYVKQLKFLNILSLVLIVISNLLLAGAIVMCAGSEISIKEFGLVAIIYIAISSLVVLYSKKFDEVLLIKNSIKD